MSELDRDELNFISSYFDDSVDKGSSSLYAELKTISDRYQGQRKLATGGMKEIFICLDTATDREVAKAVLIDQSNEAAVEDFLREARLTARLQHPNIMPVYDIAKDEKGCPFFTMKNIEGETLSNYRRTHPIHDSLKETWVDMLNMFLKISEAIAYAHSKGILHLDIKPDNIQVSQFGEILVCDWGLARIKGATLCDEGLADYMVHETMGRNLTINGYVQGSPGYMAPEQADAKLGEKDEQTDIFSLGSLLYFLITGRTAIQAKNLSEYVERLKKGDFKIPSELNAVPEGVEAICLKAMSVDKEDRYASVNDIIHDTQAYLLGFSPSAEKAGFFKQLQLFYRRNQKACLTAIVFLLIIFAGAVFYTTEINRSRSDTEAALVEVQKINQEKTELISWYKNGLMNSAMLAYKKKDYNQVLRILEDVHFIDANRLKAEIHLIKQDFVKTEELSTESGSRSLSETLEFIKDLELNESQYLSVDSIKEIFRASKVHSRYKKGIINYHLEFLATQDEKFEIIKFLLAAQNGLEEIKMVTELREKGWFVDLSGQRNLRKTNWMEFLGDIDHLDISYTGINSYRSIVKLTVRKLDAVALPMSSFTTWVNPYLEELNLAKASLETPPNLRYLRSLKTLVLPKRLAKKRIEGLRKSVNVTYE